MRHFLRNMASYSFKQLLLYVKDFLAYLLHVSQVCIYWKQAQQGIKAGNRLTAAPLNPGVPPKKGGNSHTSACCVLKARKAAILCRKKGLCLCVCILSSSSLWATFLLCHEQVCPCYMLQCFINVWAFLNIGLQFACSFWPWHPEGSQLRTAECKSHHESNLFHLKYKTAIDLRSKWGPMSIFKALCLFLWILIFFMTLNYSFFVFYLSLFIFR